MCCVLSRAEIQALRLPPLPCLSFLLAYLFFSSFSLLSLLYLTRMFAECSVRLYPLFELSSIWSFGLIISGSPVSWFRSSFIVRNGSWKSKISKLFGFVIDLYLFRLSICMTVSPAASSSLLLPIELERVLMLHSRRSTILSGMMISAQSWSLVGSRDWANWNLLSDFYLKSIGESRKAAAARERPPLPIYKGGVWLTCLFDSAFLKLVVVGSSLITFCSSTSGSTAKSGSFGCSVCCGAVSPVSYLKPYSCY